MNQLNERIAYSDLDESDLHYSSKSLEALLQCFPNTNEIMYSFASDNFIYEGDILLNRTYVESIQNIRKLLLYSDSTNITARHYVVENNSDAISAANLSDPIEVYVDEMSLEGSNISDSYKAAAIKMVRDAITAAWHPLTYIGRVRFVETSSRSGADFHITFQDNPREQYIAVAYLPMNGNHSGGIIVNTAHWTDASLSPIVGGDVNNLIDPSYNFNLKKITIHELGQTLGFAHTDANAGQLGTTGAFLCESSTPGQANANSFKFGPGSIMYSGTYFLSHPQYCNYSLSDYHAMNLLYPAISIAPEIYVNLVIKFLRRQKVEIAYTGGQFYGIIIKYSLAQAVFDDNAGNFIKSKIDCWGDGTLSVWLDRNFKFSVDFRGTGWRGCNSPSKDRT